MCPERIRNALIIIIAASSKYITMSKWNQEWNETARPSSLASTAQAMQASLCLQIRPTNARSLAGVSCCSFHGNAGGKILQISLPRRPCAPMLHSAAKPLMLEPSLRTHQPLCLSIFVCIRADLADVKEGIRSLQVRVTSIDENMSALELWHARLRSIIKPKAG